MASNLKLPALRGLGTLADYEPVIIIDNREQTPLTVLNLGLHSVPICQPPKGVLAMAQYSCTAGKPRFMQTLLGVLAQLKGFWHKLKGFWHPFISALAVRVCAGRSSRAGRPNWKSPPHCESGL
jgi:hypothetical protein